jgi:hypothetical protein
MFRVMIDPANDPLRAAVASVLARDVHGLPDGLALVSTEELIAARNLLDAAIAEHVQVLDSRGVTLTVMSRWRMRCTPGG